MALSIRSARSYEDDEEVADWVDGFVVEEEAVVDIESNLIQLDLRRHDRELEGGNNTEMLVNQDHRYGSAAVISFKRPKVQNFAADQWVDSICQGERLQHHTKAPKK